MSFDLFGDVGTTPSEFHSDDLVFEAFTVDPESAYADVMAAESYLSNCERASLGLESMYSMITGTLNRGMSDGMTEGEAAFAYSAVEGYLSLVTPHAAKVLQGTRIPAVENYDSTASRRVNTIAATESIKTALKEIWNGIRNFVLKFVDMVSKFWVEHLGAAKRLQEAAAKLKTRAEENSSSSKKENKLTINGSTYTNMMVDGTVDTGKIVSGLKDFETKLKNMTGDELEKTPTYGFVEWLDGKSNFSKMTELEALGKDLRGKEGDIWFDVDKQKAFITSKGFKESSDSRYKSDKTKLYLMSEKLMGNKMILASINFNEDKIVKSTSYSLISPDKYTSPDSKQLDAMDSSDIEKVAEAVEETCKAVVKYQIDMPKRRKLVDKARTMGDSLVKSLDGLESKEYKAGESISFYAAEEILGADGKPLQPTNSKPSEGSSDKGYSKDEVSKAKKQMKAFVNQFATNAKSIYEPGLSIQKQAYDSAKASFTWAAKCYGNLKKD